MSPEPAARLPPPGRPVGNNSSLAASSLLDMDQDRLDYADPEPLRRPHPWTWLEVAILLLAIGIAVPLLVGIAVSFALFGSQ